MNGMSVLKSPASLLSSLLSAIGDINNLEEAPDQTPTTLAHRPQSSRLQNHEQ